MARQCSMCGKKLPILKKELPGGDAICPACIPKYEAVEKRKEDYQRGKKAALKKLHHDGHYTADMKEVTYISGLRTLGRAVTYPGEVGERFFVYVHKGAIKFISANDSRSAVASISEISFFKRVGAKSNELKIRGGGGGPSVGGAMLGAAIAGIPGAIIGGGSTTDPIIGDTTTVDERVTIMKLGHSEDEGWVYFDGPSYDAFMKIIPYKEQSLAQQKATSPQSHSIEPEGEKQSATGPSDQVRITGEILDQLTKLAQLKEMGVFTEEEFIEKKTYLMSLFPKG